MQILITNVQLTHRTGTEVVVRDLERALRRRGHEVCVHTPARGVMAEDIEAAGGLVVTALDDVPFVPDIIHGHHHGPSTAASVHFPRTPMVFVCHSSIGAIDVPPILPSIDRYVAVDRNCLQRLLVTSGLDPARVELIHNAVDLERALPERERAERPRRAAVVSNGARRGGFLDHVQTACRRLGIELTVIGDGVGRPAAHPERQLADRDLVFAKARSALEAMASGCATVVVDVAGLGEMVTADNVADMADWNFGVRCMQRRPSPEAIEQEILRYCAEDAAAVTAWVRSHRSLDDAVLRWEQLYVDAVQRRRSPAVVSWAAAVGSLAARCAQLESVVDAMNTQLVPMPISCPPVPPAAVRRIRLRLVSCRRTFVAGDDVEVAVEIVNDSAEVLSSLGRTPVHLGYLWVDPTSGEIHDDGAIRTPLDPPVPPGAATRRTLVVRAPASAGSALLRISLVQEHVAWFSEVCPDHAVTARVDVRGVDAPPGLMRLSELGELAGGARSVRDAAIHDLAFTSMDVAGALVFAERRSIAERAIAAGAAALIVPPSIVDGVGSTAVGLIVSDHPRRTFAEIHRRIVETTDFYGIGQPTWVHPDARVHPTASIDAADVRIGAGCTIGPHASIVGRVTLRDGVVVDAGAILGASGFQSSHDGRGDGEMPHAGGLTIGDHSRVFAGAVVARGVFRASTVIGARARIGNLAFVSHHCRIGDDAHIGHGAIVNGGSQIGDRCWVGPGATIANGVRLGDGAQVSLGATVIRDVDAGARVTSSVAVDHWTMMRATAELERRASARRVVP